MKSITRPRIKMAAAVVGILAVSGSILAFTPAMAQESPMSEVLVGIPVDLGEETPREDFKVSEVETHTISLGTEENCVTEIWILPKEFTSVKAALKVYPDAKPISTTKEPSPTLGCQLNESLPFKGNQGESRSGNATGGVTSVTGKEERSRFPA